MPPPALGQSVTHVSGISCYLCLRKDQHTATRNDTVQLRFEATDHLQAGSTRSSCRGRSDGLGVHGPASTRRSQAPQGRRVPRVGFRLRVLSVLGGESVRRFNATDQGHGSTPRNSTVRHELLRRRSRCAPAFESVRNWIRVGACLLRQCTPGPGPDRPGLSSRGRAIRIRLLGSAFVFALLLSAAPLAQRPRETYDYWGAAARDDPARAAGHLHVQRPVHVQPHARAGLRPGAQVPAASRSAPRPAAITSSIARRRWRSAGRAPRR